MVRVDNREFNRKMREAEEKMFNMRDRAMPPVPPFIKTSNNQKSFNEERKESVKEESPPPRNRENKGLLSKDFLKFLDLKNLNLDSDRMLILLMIVLLSGENSDEILLFALAYIML